MFVSADGVYLRLNDPSPLFFEKWKLLFGGYEEMLSIWFFLNLPAHVFRVSTPIDGIPEQILSPQAFATTPCRHNSALAFLVVFNMEKPLNRSRSEELRPNTIDRCGWSTSVGLHPRKFPRPHFLVYTKNKNTRQHTKCQRVLLSIYGVVCAPSSTSVSPESPPSGEVIAPSSPEESTPS